MKLLLIAGIPGTGKTSIGNYLAEHYNFAHVDIEALTNWSINLEEIKAVIEPVLSDFTSKDQDIVVTWGFGPEIPSHKIIVKELQSRGFKMVWLDGNREAALKAFFKRGTVSKRDLDFQMGQIERADIAKEYNPIILDPFDKSGNFKPQAEVAQKLLELTH